MAGSRVCTLRAAHVAVLAGGVVSLLAGVAAGQTKQWNTGNGAWFDGARWLPNGVPGATDVTWINNGATVTINNMMAANSQDLVIAATGGGVLTSQSGSLQIGRDMVVARDNGSFGDVRLGTGGGTSNANIAGDLTVGLFGTGDMRFTGYGSMVVGGFMSVGKDNLGNGYFQQDNVGTVRVDRNLTIGDRAGSSGTYDLANGRLLSDRTFIGRDTGSSGFLNIGANGILEIGGGGFMNVGTSFSSPNATVINGGTIRAVGPNANDAMIEVSGENAEMSGIGRYDIKVRYNSKSFASPGIVSNKVALTFARDTIDKSAKLNVTQGLTVGNAASDAVKLGQISAQMVQGTEFHLAWAGASNTNQGISYNLPQGWNRPEAPEIRMAWDTSQATGPAGDEIRARARLWQFGQNSRGELAAPVGGASFNPTVTGDKANQIRNITTTVSAGLSLIDGKTANMGGEFDVAVGAKGVTPVHQDPRIATLHARGLTGAGVVFGQVEPGSPFLTHGAFDNWQSADPTALRAAYNGAAPAAGASSGHASRVASIMIGYDPLGIHVDHESRFEDPVNQINGGFGFTGVAPKGNLVTRGSSDVAAITAVAGANFGGTPVKVMNMSAGVPNSSANGQTQSERAIDHFVEANGIIFTKSAGNAGRTSAITTPGGSYNAIVVGNLEYGPDVSYPTDFDPANAALSGSSSQGPTADGRSKPDITAQGTGNYSAFTMENEYEVPLGGGRFSYISQIDPAYMESGNRGLYSTRSRQSGSEPGVAVEGTSFAAPTVAGVAGLMVQQGTISHAGADRAEAHNPLSIKSVLMTTADKRPYGGDTYRWSKGVDGAGDDANTRIPLSFRWGAGMMNPIGAVDMIATSPQEHNDHVTSSGWDYNAELTSTSRDTIGGAVDVGLGHLYDVRFDSPMVTTNFSFIATLNWFNHVAAAGGGGYAAGTLVDLDLTAYLWDGTNAPVEIARSDSAIDNVEHIWLRNGLTIPGDANGGMSFTSLLLKVSGAGWRGAAVAEPYALSWRTYLIPTPGGVMLVGVAGLFAARRRR